VVQIRSFVWSKKIIKNSKGLHLKYTPRTYWPKPNFWKNVSSIGKCFCWIDF
jgi:hypothetical protein